jgi:hypothetical protein
MMLYLHVDRAGTLAQDAVLQLQRRPNECKLNQYADMFSHGFTEHISELCEEGLSAHGIQYLLLLLEGRRELPLVLDELYLELARWNHQMAAPSRFQSFFAWGKLEDAKSFSKLVSRETPQRRIFQVEPLGEVFKGDMNAARAINGRENALKYWNGEPLNSSCCYAGVWEYLLSPPVRIVSEIV